MFFVFSQTNIFGIQGKYFVLRNTFPEKSFKHKIKEKQKKTYMVFFKAIIKDNSCSFVIKHIKYSATFCNFASN